VGSGLFFVFGNDLTDGGSGRAKAPQDESKAFQRVIASQTEGESYSTKARKDESGAHQRIVISESNSGSENTSPLRDESGADQRTVIAVPGDKTIAEWTPGCLYEVRAEKQADGAWRACFGFDPNVSLLRGLRKEPRSLNRVCRCSLP
jgi:hypothetical protein